MKNITFFIVLIFISFLFINIGTVFGGNGYNVGNPIKWSSNKSLVGKKQNKKRTTSCSDSKVLIINKAYKKVASSNDGNSYLCLYEDTTAPSILIDPYKADNEYDFSTNIELGTDFWNTTGFVRYDISISDYDAKIGEFGYSVKINPTGELGFKKLREKGSGGSYYDHFSQKCFDTNSDEGKVCNSEVTCKNDGTECDFSIFVLDEGIIDLYISVNDKAIYSTSDGATITAGNKTTKNYEGIKIDHVGTEGVNKYFYFDALGDKKYCNESNKKPNGTLCTSFESIASDAFKGGILLFSEYFYCDSQLTSGLEGKAEYSDIAVTYYTGSYIESISTSDSILYNLETTPADGYYIKGVCSCKGDNTNTNCINDSGIIDTNICKTEDQYSVNGGSCNLIPSDGFFFYNDQIDGNSEPLELDKDANCLIPSTDSSTASGFYYDNYNNLTQLSFTGNYVDGYSFWDKPGEKPLGSDDGYVRILADQSVESYFNYTLDSVTGYFKQFLSKVSEVIDGDTYNYVFEYEPSLDKCSFECLEGFYKDNEGTKCIDKTINRYCDKPYLFNESFYDHTTFNGSGEVHGAPGLYIESEADWTYLEELIANAETTPTNYKLYDDSSKSYSDINDWGDLKVKILNLKGDIGYWFYFKYLLDGISDVIDYDTVYIGINDNGFNGMCIIPDEDLIENANTIGGKDCKEGYFLQSEYDTVTNKYKNPSCLEKINFTLNPGEKLKKVTDASFELYSNPNQYNFNLDTYIVEQCQDIDNATYTSSPTGLMASQFYSCKSDYYTCDTGWKIYPSDIYIDGCRLKEDNTKSSITSGDICEDGYHIEDKTSTDGYFECIKD